MPTRIGSEFQVNTFSAGSQGWPLVAGLTNGNFVVVWNGPDQDGGIYSGIFAQLFSANADRLESEFRVDIDTNNDKSSPAVAALNSGNFVIAWTSGFQDGSWDGVYSQIFQADGAKLGLEFRVNTYTVEEQRDPAIAAFASGNFVICWESYQDAGDRPSDPDDFGIYAQLFQSDGTKIGSEFQVNTYSVATQENPSVAVLSNDDFVITWEDLLQDSISGQIFQADGTRLGTEFQVSTSTANSIGDAVITAINNGDFVVVWESQQWVSPDDYILGQRFRFDGVKLGSEFLAATWDSLDVSSLYPAISSLANGGFVVLGIGNDAESFKRIFGQIYQSDGNGIGKEFLVNPYRKVWQSTPAVTPILNGNFVVTWYGDAVDGQSTDILAQLLYGGNLTVADFNQALTYTEDISKSVNFSVLSSDNEVSLALMFSDIAAGSLSIATMGNVTSTYTSSTGVWQAIGDVNDINELLKDLQFVPAPEYHQDFSIDVSVVDSTNPTGVADTINLIGIEVLDPPVMSTSSSDFMTYLEGDSGIVIDSEVVLIDPDSINLIQATVTITNNLETSEDVLVFQPQAGINGNYNTNIGILTFSGDVNLVSYETVLRTVTYQNSAENPTDSVRTVEFQVNDGNRLSNVLTHSISVVPVDVPVLINNRFTITEGETILLTTADLSAGGSSAQDTNLIFTVTNLQGGQFELDATSTLSFTQQQIIDAQVQFVQDGSEGVSYDVSVSAGGGSTTSVVETAEVTFINVNDAPVLASSTITSVAYTEGAAGVVIVKGIIITDDDSNMMNQATVSISQNYNFGEDILEFSAMPSGISTGYDANTGVLSLTGTATIADYQSALRSIKYRDSSNSPNTNSRTIAFTVNDGDKVSNEFYSDISIVTVNNGPVLINNQLAIQENGSVIITLADLSAADPDTDDADIIFSVSNVVGGRFERVDTQTPITSFSQQQIIDGLVRFTQNGLETASFDVRVSDGTVTTTVEPAVITFNNLNEPPTIIGFVQNRTLELGTSFEFEINPSLVFKDPENELLSYQAQTIDGDPLPNWISFKVQDDQTLRFNGRPRAAGETELSLLAIDPHDSQGKVDFALSVPDRNLTSSKSQSSIAGISSGAAVGGILALTACSVAAAAGIVGLWRHHKHQQYKAGRAVYPLANLLRQELKLSGVENFESETGTAYLNAVEVLMSELRTAGQDVSSMYQNELEDFVTPLATAIRQTVSSQNTRFGRLKIDPSDLQNNATAIANALCRVDLTAAGQVTTGSEGDIEMNSVHSSTSSIGR